MARRSSRRVAAVAALLGAASIGGTSFATAPPQVPLRVLSREPQTPTLTGRSLVRSSPGPRTPRRLFDSGSFFGVGVPEALVVAFLGWFLLGPEELYKISKQVGGWLGELRTYIGQAARQYESALDDTSTRQAIEGIRQTQQTVSELAGSWRSVTDSLRDPLAISSTLQRGTKRSGEDSGAQAFAATATAMRERSATVAALVDAQYPKRQMDDDDDDLAAIAILPALSSKIEAVDLDAENDGEKEDKTAAPDQDGETQEELDEKIAKSRAAASDLWYKPEDAPDYDSWDVPKDAKAFLRRLDERLEDIEALGSELKTVTMAALPGPIYADAVAVDINLEADDVYDWERLLLSTIDEGEHVYRVYQQAGNRHYRSIDLYSSQAAARPTHNQSERALNLVMMHRLRTLEWWADVLQMDVRRLSKLGSEQLLLQWMRKPSAGSPALGVLQGNMRCRSPAREDDGSSEVMSSMYEAIRQLADSRSEEAAAFLNGCQQPGGVGYADGLHLSPDAMPHLVELLEPFLEDVAAVFSDSALCSVRDTGDAFDLAPASEVSRDRTEQHSENSQDQDRRGQVAAAVLGAVPLHPVAGRGLRGIGQELAWKLSEGEFLPHKSKILVVCSGNNLYGYEWTWPRQLREAVEGMLEACSEKGLALHLLDIVPENDIQKAGEEETAWWDDWEQQRERGHASGETAKAVTLRINAIIGKEQQFMALRERSAATMTHSPQFWELHRKLGESHG
ncbi:Sec-independent protein translocase protein TatB [Symbiodinium microadriaticum]|uniref:Sec-independent protein translocase protein TatB n=1 Tax=Symbiodinium microadriaticum TaxID=2951 RepID=A0A1Q9D2B2_SYMMI|nr:Sec-independent protein translocase protein TatB [Symbiodinium microadriaticum]